MGYHATFTIILVYMYLVRSAIGHECASLTTQCNCDAGEKGGFEIHCPSIFSLDFTVKYYPEESAEIICHRKLDYDAFKQINLRPVTFVKFESCPLPDFPLSYLIKDLKLGEILSLTFKSHQNISDSLQEFHLAGLENLNHLGLGNNGLTKIPENILRALPNLTSIIINDNNLDLPPKLFQYNPKLFAIQLGRNNLKTLPPLLFSNLTELRILNLENNDLSEIPQEIFSGLRFLEILDLHSNALATIPPGVFDGLHHLKELNLIYNKLEVIPEDMIRYNTNLQTLKLFGNRHLTTIPPDLFSNTTSLAQLNLHRCNLTAIDDKLFSTLKALRKVTLGDNKLTAIPEGLFQSSRSIQYIDLSDNLLMQLPDQTFENLKSLETLKLNGNRLKYITNKLFHELTSLTKLELQKNKLEHIEKDAFVQLTELQYLDASENYLDFKTAFYDPFTGEQKSPFHTCIELKYLNLASNNLTRMYSDWPTSHIKLEILNLRDNKIGFISLRDIYFLSEKIEVNLAYNKITTIDLWTSQTLYESIGRQTKSTSADIKIYLNQNPLRCDCLILDFLNYVQSPNVNSRHNFALYADELYCHQPQSLKNTPVREVQKDSLICQVTSGCPIGCYCYFRAVDRSVIVDCKNLNMSSMPSSLPLNTSILHLEYNAFTSIDDISGAMFENITALHLSHNFIDKLNYTRWPPSLGVLTLDNNKLKTVNLEEVEELERLMNHSKLMLSLGNNPWQCSCNLVPLYQLLPVNYQQILDINNITCSELNKPLIDVTQEKLCATTHTIIIIVSVTLVVVISILSLAVIIYYKNVHRIKVWLYAHNMGQCWVTQEELESDKIYDAFVSFSQKDEDFIMNELVCKLEGEEPYYRLCIHQRDWTPGEYIRNQIISSVENSKRTIIVLSHNFTESMWSLEEFRIAHSKTLEDRQNRIIVILYEDISAKDRTDPDLSLYLATNTYLKWGDPAFWEKLRCALPKVKQVKKMDREINSNSGTSLETLAAKTTFPEHDLVTIQHHILQKVQSN